MATFKPKLPLIDSFITKKPPSDLLLASDVASKIMRFKILTDRETRGFQKVDRDGPKGAYEHGIRGVKESTKTERAEPTLMVGSRTSVPVTSNMTDSILIIDAEYDLETTPEGESHKGRSFIELPFVPRELDYSMSSNFVGIATLGRNNPYYQFTGSEDTLTFEIDWFSQQPDRKDVINNCRWVESLTKADSFNGPPRRVILAWGSDNLLWRDDIWICVSAPYKLSDFNRGYRKTKNNQNEYDYQGEFISTSMLPQQAHQTVTLKKVSSINLSTEQIIRKI